MPAISCPVCQAQGIAVFFELACVPVHCNVLCPTREEALAVPRGDIRLGFCRSCGFIYNLAFDPQQMAYGGAYENSLHFSPRFRQYAQGLAARLIETYELRGKRIIEIACGQGDFLRMLCRMGDNRGVGFDPSYSKPPGEPDEAVTCIAEFYSPRHAGYPADLVCCRHALEHVQDPVGLLQMVRRNLAGQDHAVLFFEVPNALFTLRGEGFWDILYEHCTYFAPASLARVFQRAGLAVLNVRQEYGGQFLSIEARVAPAASPCDDRADQVAQLARDVEAFAGAYRDKLDAWRGCFERLRNDNRRVVAWGSGTKGTMFLNAVGSRGRIERIVDINPRKRGMFVPGTGQVIVAPEALREAPPDVVIVMNPIYLEEIRRTLGDMQLRADVLTA